MIREPRRGKYTKLAWYLREEDRDQLEMSFAELAAIIGKPLPRAALRKGWWDCEGTSRQAQRVALKASGFQATLLEHEQRVRFARTRAAKREREGYGKYIYLSDRSCRPRYIAIDPSKHADKCTCAKPECPRNRLRPFRDHVASLYRLVRGCIFEAFAFSDPHPWEGVLFPLLMAASISDVEADTGFVEDPMVFALCEPTIDYENARSEMASKYVAAASIFNFLWNAYEAAVAATATEELRGLLKDGRLGERGRRLFESRPELSTRFGGLDELVRLGIRLCELGGRFDDRLNKIRLRFTERDLVLAAELSREFRNFVFHGEDEVPDHPDWGDAQVAHARLYRFYVLGRLLLYLIQALASISVLPGADALEWGHHDSGDRQLHSPRDVLANVQFA